MIAPRGAAGGEEGGVVVGGQVVGGEEVEEGEEV